MKTTKEIVGLPIISVIDGIEVGFVKELIVNASKASIDYLIVDSGIQSLNAKVIHVGDILSIGDNAVIIETFSLIQDTNKIPAAIDLLQKNVQIKGTKVFTKKGKLVGQVVEFSVDEENDCQIKEIEYSTSLAGKMPEKILNDDVITYGKGVLVVSDNIFAAKISPNTAKENILDVVEDTLKSEPSAALLFEERQKQYLKGKVLTKSIIDPEGNTIFNEGTLIDDDVIEVAKEKGKFIEITMNNKAG